MRYKGTFDYLIENEPMALMVLVMHCQFGGRPLMTAVLQEILKYIAKSPDVWFARHEELANWALAAGVDEHRYRKRYFDGAPRRPRRRGLTCDRASFPSRQNQRSCTWMVSPGRICEVIGAWKRNDLAAEIAADDDGIVEAARSEAAGDRHRGFHRHVRRYRDIGPGAVTSPRMKNGR